MDEDDTKKRCVDCARDIASTARKCEHCGSYQDYRRHLALGVGFVVPVLSAIIALTSAVVSLFSSSLFDTPTIEPQLTYFGTKDLDTVEMAVVNLGDIPAYLKQINFRGFRAGGLYFDLQYTSRSEDAFIIVIAPGETKSLTLRLSESSSYGWSGNIYELAYDEFSNAFTSGECSITMYFFSAEERLSTLPIDTDFDVVGCFEISGPVWNVLQTKAVPLR